ncbi:hypothetical protein [Citricoccus sp. GCM10030269]|uniref:hypothetical protein n=1 Tax=Citricoccus sp. GCM10030269 TaxID=3273388 RepID=UPI003613C40C
MSDIDPNVPSTWPLLTQGAASVPRPPDWVEVDEGSELLVMRHPYVDEATFHPTIVVRSMPTSASLPALGAQAVAGVIGGMPGARLLAHDRGEIHGRLARGQVYAYDAGVHTIVAERWLALAGAHAVEITAQCTVGQLEDMEPLFRAVLDHTLLTDSAVADGPMPEPVREPTRDGFLAARSGLDVETLDRVSAAQPYTPVGPVLSDAAFRLVLDHIGQPSMNRSQAYSAHREAAELVATGLMDPDGTFTEAFRLLTLPVAQSRQTIRVEGVHRGEVTQLDVWFGGGGATVASRASHAQLVHDDTSHAVPAGSVQVDVIREESVPLAIAAWAGVGPAWTVVTGEDQIDLDRFQARLDHGPQIGPPEGADDALLRLWAEPWFAWRVVMPGLERELSWLGAGAAGQVRIRGVRDGRMHLLAEPSGYVWTTLVREIGILAQVR